MKPSDKARRVAAVTMSKGKMYEFGVPEEDHLDLPEGTNLELQFPLAIGTLGDAAADVVSAQLGANKNRRSTPPSELLFAAQVLVAFTEARAAPELSSQLRLLAAAAFYLAESPGSAMSLLKGLPTTAFDRSDFLARAVRFALDKPWAPARAGINEEIAVDVVKALRVHFEKGAAVSTLRGPVGALRAWSYESGTAHEVLLADILGAVAYKRFEWSAWTCLPEFTGLPLSTWAPYLSRANSVKEMWPSQRILGDAGLYKGISSVVQMPTSAGKTRATELILRAAFASGRTKIAIVVAPFRALCQEIAGDLQRAFLADGFEVNQLSDAMQADSNAELEAWLALDGDPMPHVVVLTPEKLLYLLRQEDSFVANVGLVVYDEGHQFDSGKRGVTYELLLTSIKRLLPSAAQTVLISAVIKNSAQLAGWLLGDEEKIVSDDWLQTRRLVAFASFPPGKVGQLQFNASTSGEQAFFVPRVMPVESLRVTPRENPRVFPTNASTSVALYLGLKLVANGGVAIYARMPASASKLAKDAVKEVFGRDVSLAPPSACSDAAELARIVRLYELNFGSTSYLTKAAKLGIFVHHGETPHGIRLTIEHAMREGHIRFVVCTSTLAQGVNLPIRYLLITSPTQGRDAIKARDFHNLIGRAGRAGMYGEGTVVFTEHKLYDSKDDDDDSYKWKAAQNLLSPDSAEATGSTLLNLSKPLMSDNGRRELLNPAPFDIVEGLIEDLEATVSQFDDLSAELVARSFSTDGLRRQLAIRRSTIEAIESFLMTYRGTQGSDEFVSSCLVLAKETFAHAIGTPDEQQTIEDVFKHIALRIENAVPNVELQARYGKSLFGIDRSLEIDAWVAEKLFELQLCDSVDDLIDVVWPFLETLCTEKSYGATRPEGINLRVAKAWLNGDSFWSILALLGEANAHIRQGERRKVSFSIDALVSLCEHTFGYEFSLYLAGIKAAFSSMAGDNGNAEKVEELFDLLQKRIKYGLPDIASIAYFEAGFAERVTAQAVANSVLEPIATSRHDAKVLLRRNRATVGAVLKDMPALFEDVFARLTA